MMRKKKIAVGISGGIDSLVTAHKLLQEGYEVVGLTMYMFDVDIEGQLMEPPFIQEAKDVAKQLNIEHHIIDLRDAFKEAVIEPFVDMYTKGMTPNPCALCNPTIKYGKFLDKAMEYGVKGLATGHYANIIYDADRKRYRLFKGKADRKDQSYILYSLSQQQLSQIILPLGEYDSKEETRAYALEHQLEVIQKSESMGICFVPSGDYASFIEKYVESDELLGNYMTKDGEIIGSHHGIHRHTIGQKRGLNIPNGHGFTVIAIDDLSKNVILGHEDDVYVKSIEVSDINIIAYDDISEMAITCKVCQWGYHLSGRLFVNGNKAKVVFDEPVRAVALGQAAVFYEGDEIIGGGVIVDRH